MELPPNNKAIPMVNASTTEREAVAWFDRFKESNPKLGFWPKWEIVWLIREVLAFERAALAGAAHGWREMASAPRDGSSILVYDSQSEMMLVTEWFEPDETCDDGMKGCWCGLESISANPTHWQPLPSAPHSAGGE